MTGLFAVIFLAAAIPLGIVAFAVIATKYETRPKVDALGNMKKAIQWFSWVYTGFLVCGSLVGLLIGFTTTYGDLSDVGCNFYDSLLYGIDCRGFLGAQAIEILVGFPLLIAQVSAVFYSSLIGFVFVLLLWLPVLASLYWLIKRLRENSALLKPVL